MQNTQLNNENGETTPERLDIYEHFNLPQLLAIIINASLMIGEWGRGTGKSSGPVAWRMIHCAKIMPRMAGTFLAPSYRKFMDHMWPGIRKGFTEKFKLVEGRDFVFLKRPPDSWKIKDGFGGWIPARPYVSPGSFDHFLSLRNGSGYHIISFDHGQTSNGLDTDVNITDEAKLIDGERAQEEVFNTMRGNRNYFGHLAEHYSKWIFSDKYIRANSNHSRWYSEYKNQMDENMIVEILLTVIAYQQANNSRLKEHLAQKLIALRSKAVYYSEASTLDNIHALGMKYIEGLAKTNTAYGILTSIFNEDIKRTEGNAFYPGFLEATHTYDASDNNRVDELIQTIGYDDYLLERSCKLDKDLLSNKPLKGFFDFGGTYNWGVIGQKQFNLVRFIKNFYVESPKKLRDLVKGICTYYRHHDKKVIEIYWGVDGENETPDSYQTVVDNLKKYFQEEGWTVIDMMENKVKWISHQMKFEFWQRAFDKKENRDERFPKVMMNSSNCQELVWSVSQAKFVPGEIKYKKDKRGEKNSKLVQWQQTHFSDCIDWLAIDYLEYLTGKVDGYTVSLHRF